MNKKWIPLLLALSMLIGCSSSPTSTNNETDSKKEEQTVTTETNQPSKSDSSENNQNSAAVAADEEFEALCQKYFVDICQSDYSIAHQFFQDPKASGINVDASSITLGTILPDEEEMKTDQDTLDALKKMNKEDLSQTNQDIYEQFLWELDLSLRLADPKYQYLENIWGESNGVQSNLVSFFSEYELYDQSNIDPLLKLIEDTPNYINLAVEYSQKQADMGILRVNTSTVISYAEDLLASQQDSPVKSELDEEVDALGLPDQEAEEYKEKIHAALDAYFFPAYETLISAMKSFENKTMEPVGLASLENGEEYYQLLLEKYTSTDTSMKNLYNEVFKELNSLSAAYSQIANSNPQAIADADDLATSFTSVSEIMPFLEEHYPADFPLVEDMEYEIKPLSGEQSVGGTVAYFLVPAIDSTRPGQIRYNARDYGDDPSDLYFYSTMAHEGIPGHMYQNKYFSEHFTQYIQYYLGCMAMQEGYAEYAAAKAATWLDLDADALEVYEMTEQYSNMLILMMDVEINGMGMTLSEFQDAYGTGLESLYQQLCEMPGLFFAYNYGPLVIEDFYQEAAEELGSDFDETEFNKALLKAGNAKFSIVEKNIKEYIDLCKNGA